MKRLLALGLSGFAIASLGLIGSAGSASAACATTPLTTGWERPYIWVSVSRTSTCDDLNLISAEDTNDEFTGDRYGGFYLDGGRWIQGSAGWVYAPDFTAASPDEWLVLISGVENGTPVGVGSERDGGDHVTVAH
jgi:hypothetical protein